MSIGNKILQKLFFCFKFNPDDPVVANKIEEISDKILDGLEQTAVVVNDATSSAIEQKGHVPHQFVAPIHDYTGELIHELRNYIDNRIGNEGVGMSGVVTHQTGE
jgi:hypothetical protein